MRASIDFCLSHCDGAVQHALPYARDMNEKLASKFIGMYVNDYTRDYGESGRAAIRRFLGDARRAGYVDNLAEIEFVERVGETISSASPFYQPASLQTF